MFGSRKPVSDEDSKLLEDIKRRIAAEREAIDKEKRLYQVLVNDPLDYDSLLRIGKRIGAETIEIINASGAIVRYSFRDKNTEITNAEEQKAMAEGVW
jgi:hypothetical protein